MDSPFHDAAALVSSGRWLTVAHPASNVLANPRTAIVFISLDFLLFIGSGRIYRDRKLTIDTR
jgi:hypothetical protein